ncbi:diacylglycerol kinase [Candidatus Uhrbacteria bacterium CG10_big_fil_rev_8_21_14_0_10_50_16]|uniref:Diacylglycerol kinase n=1 Tax=Candidatus Uhrbacteria bacterium CG10_big_fil_rev_8_21_14_0_10_50_16 TaxID=1975039 RepID=A0A2H0RM35_9BACT|nr:MAG: diacylglycerol kinase [Candidatus Uhrbacteria bacterium CG10_big_fil_rev_8_21_14_0_10_50_16]
MTRRSSFLSSIRHALRGVYVVFKDEKNFRVQAFFAVLILCAATLLHVRVWEYVLLLLLSSAVLILELFNSVIERIADGLKPRLQPIVRDIKDLMAGAVLLTAITAVIVGVIIFLPYFVELLQA